MKTLRTPEALMVEAAVILVADLGNRALNDATFFSDIYHRNHVHVAHTNGGKNIVRIHEGAVLTGLVAGTVDSKERAKIIRRTAKKYDLPVKWDDSSLWFTVTE
jgi:hypothetical protein